MHGEQSERSDLTPVEEARMVESAVLAVLVEHHPQLLSMPELVAEMAVGVTRPGRAEAVKQAVDALVAVDLLLYRGERLEPTPGALRMAELELGLTSSFHARLRRR